jgi:hypothetical protein
MIEIVSFEINMKIFKRKKPNYKIQFTSPCPPDPPPNLELTSHLPPNLELTSNQRQG